MKEVGSQHWLGRLLAVAMAASMFAGCTTEKPAPEKTRPIGECDYAVIKQEVTYGFLDDAPDILEKSFIFVPKDDFRLKKAEFRRKACSIEIRWRRGFWYRPEFVEVADIEHHTLMFSTEVRANFWGLEPDAVPQALREIAAARGAGPASTVAPKETAVEAPEAPPPPVARSKAERLRELNSLKAEGLITEKEYSAQRAAIIQEP